MSPDVRSVLAASDFSPAGALALRRAAQLAGTLGASLHLLHVVDSARLSELHALAPDAAGQVQARVLEEARRELADAARDLGVTCETRAEVGTLPGSIVEAARLHDLLVLGAHGASTLRSVLLGSTAERLLLRSERPILVAKADAAGPYRSVVVPCEYAPPARRALELALKVAPQARVTLVYAHELDFEARLWRMALRPEQVATLRESAAARARGWLEGLARDLPGAGRVSAIVVHGPASRMILEMSTGADLVVMGKQGRSATGEAFLGSVTRRVLAEAPCDVLVLPASREPPAAAR